jgi:hypothetical protein
MAHHPPGITVELLGIDASDQGRSCEEHDVCGEIVDLDVVVRLRRTQVVIDGVEETAIAAYWVTTGIDRCRVGFLPKFTVKHWQQFDGKLAQVVEMYRDSESPSKRSKAHRNKGACQLVLIECVQDNNTSDPVKRKRKDPTTEDSSDSDK